MSKIFDSDHPFITISYWTLRKIASLIIRPIFIKKVNGFEHIPTRGSALLAFNHQSFLDFICFAAISPRNIHFLAAEKFFENRLSYWLMVFTGQIRVDRKKHNKEMLHDIVTKHALKGSLIGIFPEGTRSPFKDQMLKAFTGVAQFALKCNIPVIPVGLHGTFDLLPKSKRYPLFKKNVEIHIGKPMYFEDFKGRHTDREVCLEVTEKIMKQLEVLSNKSYPHYELV